MLLIAARNQTFEPESDFSTDTQLIGEPKLSHHLSGFKAVSLHCPRLPLGWKTHTVVKAEALDTSHGVQDHHMRSSAPNVATELLELGYQGSVTPLSLPLLLPLLLLLCIGKFLFELILDLQKKKKRKRKFKGNTEKHLVRFLC